MESKRMIYGLLVFNILHSFKIIYGLSCSWEILHCDREEVVCTDEESVVLDGRNPTKEHCLGIKDMAKGKLKNYEISVDMLSLESKEGVNSGYLGIIFNFMDQQNYDFVYLE